MVPKLLREILLSSEGNQVKILETFDRDFIDKPNICCRCYFSINLYSIH